MRRLHNKQHMGHNQFSLHERGMEQLYSFRPEYEFYPNETNRDEILEHFELLYELEYKYSMIKSRPFEGLPQRYENILKIIESKAQAVIEPLAKSMKIVFHEWLKNHALTDPEEWAYQRVHDGEAHVLDYENLDHAMGMAMGELSRYRPRMTEFDVYQELAEEKPEIFEDLFDALIKDRGNMMYNDLESMGVEEFNDMYESVFDQQFESEDEARDAIDTYFAGWDKDFFRLQGGKKDATWEIIDWMNDMDMWSNEQVVNNYIDLYDFIEAIYEHIVFPAWYAYWKPLGIDKTRANVEKVYNQLTNIERMPIEKQFLTMNIALNTSHQNGSMMEYYGDMYEIFPDDLQELSDMDTKEWDEDLREIGVVV